MKERIVGKNLKDVNMKKLFRRNQIIITTLAIMIAAAGYLNYAGKRELEASAKDAVFEAGALEISDDDLLAENQAAGLDLLDQSAADQSSLPQDGDQPVDAAVEEAQSAAYEQNYYEGESLAEIDSWDGDEEAGLDNPGEAVLTSGMTVSDYIATVQLNREQVRAKNKETLNNIIDNTNIEEAAKQEAIQNMIAMTAIAEKENAAETLLQAKGFADPVVSLSEGKVDVVINASAITDQQRAQIEDIVKRKTEIPAEGIVITLLNLEE
ncbi:MAG: SpoIIIAH-like family protein [Eubacteriales bacterium]|nr:SpoIIIAH-like family protein [Eubacteriales bacterium]